MKTRVYRITQTNNKYTRIISRICDNPALRFKSKHKLYMGLYELCWESSNREFVISQYRMRIYFVIYTSQFSRINWIRYLPNLFDEANNISYVRIIFPVILFRDWKYCLHTLLRCVFNSTLRYAEKCKYSCRYKIVYIYIYIYIGGKSITHG